MKLACAAAVLSLASVIAAPAEAQYRFVHLGAFAPPSSYPTAINNRNQVVGASSVPGDPSLFHGFLWENGRLTDLGTWPGGFISEARDINDAGVITLVGFNSPVGGEFAYRLERGVLTFLPPPPGYSSSVAVRLNDRGDAVGYSYAPGNPGPVEATVWHGTEPIAVGFPPGNRTSIASGINARGVVAGGGFTGNLGQVGDLPFLWADGTMHLLPIPPGRVGAQAVVINDRGVIAGVAILPAGDTYAVLWVPDRSRNGGGAP